MGAGNVGFLVRSYKPVHCGTRDTFLPGPDTGFCLEAVKMEATRVDETTYA